MKTKIILFVGATTLSCLPLLADNLSDYSNNRTNVSAVRATDNTTTVNPASQYDPTLQDRGQAQNNLNQPPAIATDGSTQYSDRTQRDRDEYSSREHLGDLRRANQIIGQEITDDQGRKLGRVKDLALDLQNGRVVEVIVGTGGMLGVDERLIAVPPSSFTCDKTMKALRLNLDQDQIKNAPAFVTADWTTATGNGQIRETYQRYGVSPYFGQTGMAYTNSAANSRHHGNVADNDSALHSPDTVASSGNNQNNNADMNHHHNWRNENLSLGYVASANHLMGTSAWNDQNEKLGKVKNFIVDLPAGRVVEVVIATGGFLGMDQELSAVPPQSFRWNADNTAVTLDTTRDNLKSAPHFKASEWGYATDPATVTEVYSTYRVPAYFQTDVDNSRQNVRDRSGNTVTPMNQSNSQSDIDTTAQIRKAVMADSALSVNAKNVKIITANGRVTLRGVVNNQQEKDAVCADATTIASKANVDDQLKIRHMHNNNNESPSTSPTSTDSTDTTIK